MQLPLDQLFFAEVHLHGGPAPVRRYLAMHERRAIKVMLTLCPLMIP